MLASVLSFIAILGLAGLNAWLGRSGRLTRDPGAAATRIALDLIDFEARDGADANGGQAYVALGAASDDLALAVALGDGWVTRRLRPGSLRAVSRTGARLALRTLDFALPAIDLEFANADHAARWEARFNGLTTAALPAAARVVPAQTVAREARP